MHLIKITKTPPPNWSEIMQAQNPDDVAVFAHYSYMGLHFVGEWHYELQEPEHGTEHDGEQTSFCGLDPDNVELMIVCKIDNGQADTDYSHFENEHPKEWAQFLSKKDDVCEWIEKEIIG